jgi:iron complex outermembrane receptor protein
MKDRNMLNSTTARFILALSAASMVVPAWASADEAEQKKLDTITVTSQKREAALDDVPLSVAALSGDDLSDKNVTELEGVADLFAGLEINSVTPGENTLAIRGVVDLANGEDTTASVAVYLDETPISAFSSNIPEVGLIDLARVEVLRGPQGTLFGQGASGGAVRIITNKPDATTYSGKFNGTIGTIKDGSTVWTANGVLNIPISKDKLAARVAAGYVKSDGWIDTPELGQEDTNDLENLNVRAALRYTPTPSTTFDLSYTHQELDVAGSNEATSPGVFEPSAQDLSPFPSALPLTRLRASNSDYDVINGTLNWDLGGASLVSATSYYDQSSTSMEDVTPQVPLFFGVPAGTIYRPYDTTVKVFSQEVRLASNGDSLFDWTVGAFYKKNERTAQSGFDITLDDIFGPGIPLQDFGITDQTSKIDSYAVFGEGEYELSEKLALTVGMRYYWEDRTATIQNLTDSPFIFGLAVDPSPVKLEPGDDNAFTSNFILSYDVSDDTLLFVRASQGFKPGGYNYAASVVPIPATYKRETLWSYEAGTRTTLTDWWKSNLFIYYTDWTDLQLFDVTSDGLFGFRGNVGKARASGVEFENVLTPFDGLTATVNIAYNDTEFTEGSADGSIAKGNTVPFTPKFTLGASFEYRHPLANGKDALFQLDYAYRGKTYSDPANTPADRNDVYNQVGLNAGIENDKSGVYFFVDNLFNEDDTTRIFTPIDGTPLTYTTYVRPRTIGIRLKTGF